MDLESALSLIDNTFDKWLIDEDINLFKESNVIQALNICLDTCIENGDDYPAFYYDDNDINGLLHYISDRWFCSGRIRFILEVIEE